MAKTPEGSMKVTKKEWYRLGGLKNPRCWRRMVNGRWEYYVTTD